MLGDITQGGHDDSFVWAQENFTELTKTTNIDRVWSIGGGCHDGLYSKTDGWKMGFYRILNQTSQWYTLKIGNNVFVMTGFFKQPGSWSSGQYGGTDDAALFNQNKINWLNRTLAKWNGTGNNIFICHHFPLHHTNIWTHSWAGMKSDRFVYECNMIQEMLKRYTDVVVWFNGHIHVDSNATYDSGDPLNVSKGTAVSGASRNDLPDNVHFISEGDIWREHERGWLYGKSTVANFRYIDFTEGQNYIDIMAWDATNNISTNISVNDTTDEVPYYRINLPHPISNISDPIEYEQGWDVWQYSDEGKYQWYLDSEGLYFHKAGWIESRWDFWHEKNFSRATLEVDSSDTKNISYKIYYSDDGMKTWSGNYYTPANLTEMPNARWVKLYAFVNTSNDLFIRDIRFNFTGIENKKPEKPTVYGSTTGRPGEEYNYSVFTVDPENDDVYYKVYWGDNTTTGWIGPYQSGENVSVKHSWEKRGDYKISAKAKDSGGVESNWSNPHNMSITAPELHMDIRGGIGLTFIITNIGDYDACGGTINISIVGRASGNLSFYKNTSSNQVIKPGEHITIKMFRYGFGRVNITAIANTQYAPTVDNEKHAFMIGYCFILLE